MPLDEQPSVTPTDIVRHLWARRYLLLLAPGVFFVLTYAYSVFLMGEAFETSATLLLRNTPSTLRDGPRLEKIDAPSIPDLISSDSILLEVITAARKKYPSYPQGNFEKIKGAFKVRTVMTRDTTVQASYSPAVILTARARTPEIALFLVEEWTRVSVERFGRMRSREALQIQETASASFEKFSAEAAELAAKQTDLELRRDELDSLYASRQALLAGSATPYADGQQEKDTLTGGYFGEKARLDLELAAANSDTATANRARLAHVTTMIQQVNGEIELLNKDRAAVRNQLEAVRRELLVSREKAGQMRQILTTTTADATLIPDPLNPEVSGDLGILAKPILPESRVSPQRGLIASGGAVFLTAVLLALLLIELYIRRTVLEA
jgi:outer membrane murein-binding lipoprotein Lpp